MNDERFNSQNYVTFREPSFKKKPREVREWRHARPEVQ